MRTRKTIGLFLEGDDTLQEGIITKAVLKEATDKDYNVLIFHSLMKKPAYEHGELSDEVVPERELFMRFRITECLMA